ncbi:hypothetical protein XENOCAPTIV_028751 [Xenoophorus captivus]|uniref:Sema domain-containing protein n=1 Tax=Xenoophorus captivus TaxID=1517983 RepID=A0ABV0Q3H1_9TELE
MKTQSAHDECQNYIRVLLISGRTLFTCGTNAFTPVCISRQVGTHDLSEQFPSFLLNVYFFCVYRNEKVHIFIPFHQIFNISQVLDTVNGVARCPYDPWHNSTAMVTERGELYAATVIDFSGRDPVIYRSLGNMPPLRTAQYNSKWLNG